MKQHELLRDRASTPEWLLHNSAVLHKRSPAPQGFYGFLFLRDLHKQHYAFRPRLSYDGVERQVAEDVLCSLLGDFSLYGDSPSDATEAFMDLVNKVGTEHSMYGKCWAELYRVSPRGTQPDMDAAAVDPAVDPGVNPGVDPSGDPGVDPGIDTATAPDVQAPASSSDARLTILPGWSLRHRRGRLAQLVSHDDAEPTWQTIPSASARQIELPERLSQRLASSYRSVVLAGRYRPGGPALPAKKSPAYDFAIHTRMIEELLLRATRDIGWDSDALLHNRATTTHKTYRALRFLDTWLTLAQGVLDHLNQLAADSRIHPHGPFTITLDGAPDRKRVATAAQNLRTGAETNDHIFNTVLHPPRPW